jgi:type II secretory pathway pseudopilin PulG
MIVSLGIFSFVAVIAVGALVRITGLNRQAQSLQSAMNNINFALESLSREMRFGTNYHCEAGKTSFSDVESNGLSYLPCNDTTSSSYVLAFKSTRQAVRADSSTCQLVYAYWFDNGTIKKDQQTGCDDGISLAGASEIIDSRNVHIDEFSLHVGKPATLQTNKYSLAIIRIHGYSGTKENEKNIFDIRTGVSQRIAD